LWSPDNWPKQNRGVFSCVQAANGAGVSTDKFCDRKTSRGTVKACFETQRRRWAGVFGRRKGKNLFSVRKKQVSLSSYE
jgi:hypothetical protein